MRQGINARLDWVAMLLWLSGASPQVSKRTTCCLLSVAEVFSETEKKCPRDSFPKFKVVRLWRENSNVCRMQNRNYTSTSVQSQLRLVQDRALSPVLDVPVGLVYRLGRWAVWVG